MPIRLTILGSGSNGNCAFIETDQTRLLIDAGFSLKQIRQRLALIGRAPETLTGVLVTHEHSDHVQGLGLLAQKFSIPVYCNRATSDGLGWQLSRPLPCRVFETGSAFDVGDIHVETFSVPHDAQDPVGFVLGNGKAKIGFLTDLGHVTKLVIERARSANALVIEANHDVKLLQDCPHRPWSLKQRILSRHGHLSNAAAAEAVREMMTADMRYLYLGHISRECNRPELAQSVVAECLRQIGASHVQLEVASQTTPCATLPIS